MTITTEHLLRRLRDGAIDDLVGLGVDHLMDRPVAELLDPAWVADQVVAALDTAARAGRAEEWLREQLREVRQHVPDGQLRDHVPAEVLGPMRQTIARPMVPDRELVGRLLNDAAVERLLRDVLSAALRDYAKKLSTVTQGVTRNLPPTASKGFGRLKAFGAGARALGDGVLGGIGKEIEAKAEQKSKEFVDSALKGTMAQVADHLCDPTHAPAYGAFRAHVVDTLLDTDNHVLAAELEKLDPEGMVDTGTAISRALAGRAGLADQLAGIMRTALEGTGGRTVRDFLRESGLEADAASRDWRSELVGQLSREAHAFIETDEFGAWLGALTADDPIS